MQVVLRNGYKEISSRIIIFLTPVLDSQGMKKYAMQYKKYNNQAEINLTPPPSQNSHAVRGHCTAESERRGAEIKSLFLSRRSTDQQQQQQE